MPVLGILNANTPVDISFDAGPANAGPVGLRAGFVGGPVLGYQLVAPGGAAKFHGTVPAGAKVLEVAVDVPDGGGSGNLTVKGVPTQKVVQVAQDGVYTLWVSG